MNRPAGVLRPGQLMFPADGRGQRLPDLPGAQRHRLPGKLEHQVIGNSGGQGIDGDNAPGDGLPVRPLEYRVGHGAAASHLLDRAVKNIFLPRLDGPLDIALVEKREPQTAAVVHDLDPDQLQPAPDAGQDRRLGRQGADAAFALQGGGADGPDLPAVLVVFWEKMQKIPRLTQAQLFQLLPPGLSDAGELGERRVNRKLHRRASGLAPGAPAEQHQHRENLQTADNHA